MESLDIHAGSRESAEGFRDASRSSDAKLVASEDGRYLVEIPLAGIDTKKIVAVLNALEAYVTRRGGPVRVELDGHPYLVDPAPAD